MTEEEQHPFLCFSLPATVNGDVNTVILMEEEKLMFNNKKMKGFFVFLPSLRQNKQLRIFGFTVNTFTKERGSVHACVCVLCILICEHLLSVGGKTVGHQRRLE